MNDQTKARMQAAGDSAKQAADHGKDAMKYAGDAGSGIVQAVADKAGDLADQGKRAVGQVMEGAQHAGEKVQRWAGDAYETTTKAVGDATENVSGLIRRHPLPAVLIGFGVGLIIGRLLGACPVEGA